MKKSTIQGNLSNNGKIGERDSSVNKSMTYGVNPRNNGGTTLADDYMTLINRDYVSVVSGKNY